MSNRASKVAVLGIAIVLGFGAANLARAYPEGAPWGASVPTAEQSCASCHYDYEPVMSSAAIEVDGWPESFIAGKRYLLTLRFRPPTGRTAGFQVTTIVEGEAQTESEAGADSDRGKAGVFVCGPDGVEIAGAGIRSLVPRPIEDGLSWSFAWRAPDTAADIVFHVAASASNDDASPFGDIVHYRTFRTAPQR